MAKKGSTVQVLLGFLAWLTGVVVSLSVGIAMTDQILTIGYGIPVMVTVVAGWIVVITTLISVILAIVHYFSK